MNTFINKKLIAYIVAGIVCIAVAFFPLDKVAPLVQPDESSSSVSANLETKEEVISSSVETKQSEPAGSSEPTSVVPTSAEPTSIPEIEKYDYNLISTAVIGGYPKNIITGNLITEVIDMATTEGEDNKEKESTPEPSKSEDNKPEQSSPTPNNELRPVGPVHNAIPGQSESTQFCGQDINNSVRQKLIAALGSPGSYSADCQNVAIMRANGSPKSAGAIFTDYGNNVTWKETSAYEYTMGLADNQLGDCVSKLCNNLSRGADGCDRFGIGVNISKEDEYYRIKVSVVFSN